MQISELANYTNREFWGSDTSQWELAGGVGHRGAVVRACQRDVPGLDRLTTVSLIHQCPVRVKVMWQMAPAPHGRGWGRSNERSSTAGQQQHENTDFVEERARCMWSCSASSLPAEAEQPFPLAATPPAPVHCRECLTHPLPSDRVPSNYRKTSRVQTNCSWCACTETTAQPSLCSFYGWTQSQRQWKYSPLNWGQNKATRQEINNPSLVLPCQHSVSPALMLQRFTGQHFGKAEESRVTFRGSCAWWLPRSHRERGSRDRALSQHHLLSHTDRFSWLSDL